MMTIRKQRQWFECKCVTLEIQVVSGAQVQVWVWMTIWSNDSWNGLHYCDGDHHYYNISRVKLAAQHNYMPNLLVRRQHYNNPINQFSKINTMLRVRIVDALLVPNCCKFNTNFPIKIYFFSRKANKTSAMRLNSSIFGKLFLKNVN